MQLLVRFGFILLFIGGLFLTPMCANASEQNQTHVDAWEAEHVNDQQQSLGLAVADILPSLSTSGGNPVTLKDNHAQKKQSNDSEYAPLVSQRFVSFSQHDLQQTRPDYLLAFEFVSPAVPSLTVGYRIDFAPALDWLLHIKSASHRLSAWKESNLLYRFSQARSLA
ncbi:hypothetical protein [Shewanella pealeana]|uniref:Uncharacterized protein n=1 Tax=Shewanella pealeana (strain ATCC 700345 / ANG-SQ1) TaxID=398579 RepID=A8H752_SHEPA|nr:hypothetical protein [Shewanella pealeana]ABV88389.1 hypothetical protein Spea_3072 [Shewanella pealeana ATCC 700345]